MKRVATAVILLASLVLGTAASGSIAESPSSTAPAAKAGKSATTLTVWVGWSARELNEFKKVVAEYDRKNAAVDVKVVGGINDDKIIAALRGGNAPDVVSSFTSANVGIYCPSGGWVDLDPFLKRDKISTSIFPAATLYYTQYQGKRCALPLLADVYGFYYNKAMFQAAGIKNPPKTLGELTAMAKKLTTKNADGSLKVVGYNPFFGFYQNTAGAYQPSVNAKWFDAQGKSSLAKDPQWSKLLRWQKSLIDYYGHKNLVKWNAGAGDEFSASHAFETGKLAMMIDGEWRVAFIGAEHPELKYGTAPMPVEASQLSRYGSGYINGTIIGIPKSAKNKDASWALVKYLTTNSHALAQFSNGIRNVPSTKAAAKSKELKPDANFATFTRIFANPKSQTTPITSAGAAYLDTFANFLAKWQAGKVSNLKNGLQDVDKQIDAKLKQSGGGVP
ncbi:MAG TPA: extracellular solute-binding protein [Gaiellaceae bacterium]|nr:extracellular solute-binding protein [Gaiellaceae bacterium]